MLSFVIILLILHKQGHPTQSLKTLFEFEIAVSKERRRKIQVIAFANQEHCFRLKKI